mmetsp:Transcript_6560/g.11257  ORF Transcript_6560/g.11257 Transcript_6560/m.11257 type:complete len:90 (+) Transcript_6560:334-603(+)
MEACLALASVVLLGVHPEASLAPSLALHQARQAGASLEEAAQVALLALAAGVLEAHLAALVLAVHQAAAREQVVLALAFLWASLARLAA